MAEERKTGLIPLLKDHAQIAGGLAALATVITSMVGLLWDRGGGADAGSSSVAKSAAVEIIGAEFGSRLNALTNDLEGAKVGGEATLDVCAPASLYGVTRLHPKSDMEVGLQWLQNNVLVEEQRYVVPAGDARISLELAAPAPGNYSLRLHSAAAAKSQTWRVTVRCEQRSRLSGATVNFAVGRTSLGFAVGSPIAADSDVEMCPPSTPYGFVQFQKGTATSAELRSYKDQVFLKSDPIFIEADWEYVSYGLALVDVEPGLYTLQLVVPSTNEAFSWNIRVRCASAVVPTPTPVPSPIGPVQFGRGDPEVESERVDSGGELSLCAPGTVFADVYSRGQGVKVQIEWLRDGFVEATSDFTADEPGYYSSFDDPEPGLYTYRVTLLATAESRSWTVRIRC